MHRLLGFLADASQRNARCTLTVGVLIDGETVPAWVKRCLECLSTLQGVELELFALKSPERNQSAESLLLWRRYQQFCRRATDPERPARLGEILRSKLQHSPLEVNEQGAFTRPARSSLQARRLHVLLLLSSLALQGDCSGLAQLGAWSLAVDGRQSGGGGSAFFWNVYRGSETVSLSLILHQQRFDAGRVIYQYEAATSLGFNSTQNMVDPVAATGFVIALRLLNVQEGGLAAFATLDTWGSADVRLERPPAPPGDIVLTRFLLAKIVRSVRLRFPWNNKKGQWFVAFRRERSRFTAQRDQFCPDGFEDLVARTNYECADPFAVRKDGRNFVFFEEMLPPKRFGRLAVAEIEASGPVSPPTVVLERPYHLSYPCVFEHEGEYYMIPESSENSTVDLYRCTRFPDVWRHEKTLVSDVSLVDTTPLLHEGRWYFFTTAIHPKLKSGMHTLLFQSEGLDAPWSLHPATVICSDARRARCGGFVFLRNGRLIRPSQNCTIRYGRAIVLNEITELSPQRYREHPVETILPTWRQDLLATHTLNSNSELEVIDGLRVPQR